MQPDPDSENQYVLTRSYRHSRARTHKGMDTDAAVADLVNMRKTVGGTSFLNLLRTVC